MQHGASNYEELGYLAHGLKGKKAVILFKFLYSFGCCIAYMVVLKKNMNIAIADLAGVDISCDGGASCSPFILDENFFTFLLCTVIILPLCLHRKLDRLAKFSFISIVSVLAIVSIIIYEYKEVREKGSSFEEKVSVARSEERTAGGIEATSGRGVVSYGTGQPSAQPSFALVFLRSSSDLTHHY